MVTRLPTNWNQWLGAVLGSVLVGLAGVLPLAVVPASKVGGGAVSEDSLKYLLGFAAGGLLGDVFLHLLPETYQQVMRATFYSHLDLEFFNFDIKLQCTKCMEKVFKTFNYTWAWAY